MTTFDPVTVPEVAGAGLGNWIERVVALAGMGAGLAAILLSFGQVASLRPTWLVAVVAALLVSCLLLPVFAWTFGSMRIPAIFFAATVAIGLWTWPLAWTGPLVTGGDSPPWLWPCIGVSTVVVSVAWGLVPAVTHNLVCFVAYLMARLSPLGGAITAATAVQDALAVVVQPMLVMGLFVTVRHQAAALDSWVAAARRRSADAALRATLVDERARMDALVHDVVMTALVAGARSVGHHDSSVTSLAQRAITSLQEEAAPDPDDTPFPPVNVGRLMQDVAMSVNPGVRFHADIDPLAPLLPRGVVEAMAQALREAVLNAEKHAAADEVTVRITCMADRTSVHLRVQVTDDGVGFDPDAVPERRLGIRLSLQRRLESVDGLASVHSAPGEGTRVTLSWSGSGAVDVDAPIRTTPLVGHPALNHRHFAPIALSAGAGATLFSAIAAIQAHASDRPELVWLAQVLLCIAMPLSLRRFGQGISMRTATVVAALGVLVTGLNLAALPLGPWPLHGTAFLGSVCILVVLLRAGGRRGAATTLSVAAGVLVLAAIWRVGGSPLMELGAALNPVGWLIAAEMLLYWMRRVQHQLDLTQRAADAASAESAVSFARLVVREVWVADIRDLVGDLLAVLADPDAPIAECDKEACLAAEGNLRDRIKSANFNAPALSAAIGRARMRGVQVTLVDNRGGQLEERVRRLTARLLEQMVDRATQGRIVARTAPAGYEEAVTIVETGENGSSLTRISDDGTIVVMQT